MKRHTGLWTLPAIVGLVGSFGCADHAPDLTNPVVREQASVAPTQSSTGERAALTTITRAVALALANDAFRAEVLTEMRNAPFKEHKLELRQYLNPGRLARLAAASGKTASELASALQTVRPLEFYMPVPSQRESWIGDANILIASQLEEGDEIVAFDVKGRTVALTEASAPPIPTLSIVPVETRFSEPLAASRSQNINTRDGRAIGTMVSCDESPGACASTSSNRYPEISRVIDCGFCGDSGGSSYGTPGFYMTFSRLVDMGESWLKGDPEIEVHVHGPTTGAYPLYGEDLACSGELSQLARRFNQNNVFWNGSVLIWTDAQSSAFNAQFPNGHNIMVWEDDDTACTLKFDKNTLMGALTATAAAVGGAALKAGWTPTGWSLILASFLASAYNQATWLYSNDDFLGVFVPASSHGDYWYDANYTLLRGTAVNGRAYIASR
jgi:hypothetical protein